MRPSPPVVTATGCTNAPLDPPVPNTTDSSTVPTLVSRVIPVSDQPYLTFAAAGAKGHWSALFGAAVVGVHVAWQPADTTAAVSTSAMRAASDAGREPEIERCRRKQRIYSNCLRKF